MYKDLVERLHKRIALITANSPLQDDLKEAADAIEELDMHWIPAADPVEHVEWLEHRNGQWVYAKCSKCKIIHDVRSNYCPNCGADMRGCKE